MGPQRTTDPFAPLAPTPGASAPESGSTTVTAAGGTVDAGVSGAAVLSHLLGRSGFFFGVYGTFEEADLLGGKPAAAPAAEASPSPRAAEKK